MPIKQITGQNGTITYMVYATERVGDKRLQRKKRGITSLRAAKEVEALMNAELLLEKGRPKRLTWGMWFPRHLEQMKLVNRPSTLINYDRTLNKWVTPILKDRFLDELTTSEVHDVIFNKTEGLSLGSKRSMLDLVKRVLNAALEQGVIVRNPAKPLRVKVPQPVQLVLTATEAQKLLEEAKATRHRFYGVWGVALFTGMRSGELYALKWSDVDMENGRIYISRSWSSKCGYGPTKSQRNRVVPISDSLRELLVELKSRPIRDTQEDDSQYVLPHMREWTNGDQASVLRDFCKSIGVTPIRFHDLRATFITQLLLRGVSLAQVMAMVGHADLKTTNVYLRVVGSDLAGATEKLTYTLPQEHMGELISLGAARRK